jgi:hypothetical protein
VETGGQAKQEWGVRFLDLAQGIPSPDPFGRVLARVSPEALPPCFLRWLQAGAQVRDGQVGASDGKPRRRSSARRSAKAAIPRGSAWATAVNTFG